jgi:hypothetical protein
MACDISDRPTAHGGPAGAILAPGMLDTGRLCFTRDGARLVVRTEDAVRLMATDDSPPLQLTGAAQAVATVGDEIWIVEGTTATLHRFSETGARLGAPRELWGSSDDGRLVPAAMGSPAALWTAPRAAIVRAGDPVTVAVPDADFLLPVSPTRWLCARREELSLREPTAERWASPLLADQRVVSGAALFDGRLAVLVLAPGGAQTVGRAAAPDQILVISLHNAAPQHRLKLVGVDAIAIASVRGFALFRTGAHRLTLVDLRFGRVVHEHLDSRRILDVAIDATAQRVGISFEGDDGSRSVQIVTVRELFQEAQPSASVRVEDEPREAPSVQPAPVRLQPPLEPREFHRHHAALTSLAALAPRPQLDVVEGQAAEALLDRYRELIAALTGRAIARAWDAGRLTFPDEGDMPYRVEVAGLLGRNPSLAAVDVKVAEREVRAARAAVDAAEAATAPQLSPLAALGQEFGLSPVARLVLVAVAAPAQWGEMARLYGILGNDEARPLCDELLLQQILDGEASRVDVARELDRDAPLVLHGLVRPGDGRMRPFIALTVEPLALRRLRGRDLDEDLGDVRIVPSTTTFEAMITTVKVKDAVARALAAPAAKKPRVVIRGRIGSGRHTMLAILAEATGRRLGAIDATSMVRDLRGRAGQLEAALRRAHVLGLLPVVDGLEHIASDDQVAREQVRDILAQHPGPLAVRLPWDAEPPLPAGYIAIDLPTLSGDQRLVAWNETLARANLFVRDPAELAMRYAVGPGVMARAAEAVAKSEDAHADNGSPPDVAAAIESAIRQHLETRLRATASRVHRLATWSQVILPPDIQESLLELIARIKHRRIVFDVWGFDSVMSTSRGVTALFQGGPGTGKTLVASAIANELGMDLYRVDVSRIMSKWIGETEQNLAKLFDAAEDGQAIILFDEADSLFGKRTEVRTSVDRYANLEVNYLLQRLDTFEGIAILTTNFGTAIDSAFKRRLSFRLTFPFPDEEMREKLWAGHLPADVPRAGTFDLGGLARRFRLSGGYIRNAALRAAFLAAEEHTPLTQDHLERAIRAEFREIGKLSETGVLE